MQTREMSVQTFHVCLNHLKQLVTFFDNQIMCVTLDPQSVRSVDEQCLHLPPYCRLPLSMQNVVLYHFNLPAYDCEPTVL